MHAHADSSPLRRYHVEDPAAVRQIDQAKPMAFQLANSAYESIIGAGSLAAYLEQQSDAQLVETEYFKRSSPPSGVTADPAFLDRAFELQEFLTPHWGSALPFALEEHLADDVEISEFLSDPDVAAAEFIIQHSRKRRRCTVWPGLCGGCVDDPTRRMAYFQI